MTKLAFLDSKTTGLDSTIHHMWELAFIVRDDGAPRDADQEHFFQFRQPGLAFADPVSLKISKFWTRMEPLLLSGMSVEVPSPSTAVARSLSVAMDETESAWTFVTHKLAALEIAKLLADATVVGSNPGFDASHSGGFLTNYVQEHGFPPSWSSHSIDVFALAYGYVLNAEEAIFPRAGLSPSMNRTGLYTRLLGAVPDQVGSLAVARTVRDVWDYIN